MPTLKEFATALFGKQPNLIDIINNSKFNFNELSPEGLTPLHLAVAEQNVTAVKALLDKGANKDAKGIGGSTPLHFAIEFDDADGLMIKELISAGARTDILDDKSRTPFIKAIQGSAFVHIKTLTELGVAEAVTAFKDLDAAVPSESAVAKLGEESSLPKLKSVLLIGLDSKLHKIPEAYNTEQCQIIGDGNSLITLNQLDVLKGRVDSSTRFDIFGHGYSVNTPTAIKHMIALLDSNELPVTANVINKINELVGAKPVEVHLWCCYAAAEMSLVTKLARGSILVAHTHANLKMTGSVPFYGIPESINQRKALAISDGILDLNAVLKTSHLGAGAGIYFAINSPNGSKLYRTLDFNVPRTSVMIKDDLIRDFFASIHKSVYSMLLECSKGLDGVKPPSDPVDEFSPKEVSLFMGSTIISHINSFDTPISNFVDEAYSDLDMQDMIISRLVHNENKLFQFLDNLKTLDCNITRFFTGENVWINTELAKESELPKFVELLQRLGILEEVNRILSAKYAGHPLPIQVKANSELIEAAKEGDVGKVKAALAKKAYVNTKDKLGLSALHYAVDKNHMDVVLNLIADQADVNIKSKAGVTPLHMAANSGHSNIVALLLSVKVEIDETTNKGSTALHIAAKKGLDTVIIMLTQQGASLLAKNPEGKTPLELLPAGCSTKLKTLLTPVAEVVVAATVDEASEAPADASSAAHGALDPLALTGGGSAADGVAASAEG